MAGRHEGPSRTVTAVLRRSTALELLYSLNAALAGGGGGGKKPKNGKKPKKHKG